MHAPAVQSESSKQNPPSTWFWVSEAQKLSKQTPLEQSVPLPQASPRGVPLVAQKPPTQKPDVHVSISSVQSPLLQNILRKQRSPIAAVHVPFVHTDEIQLFPDRQSCPIGPATVQCPVSQMPLSHCPSMVHGSPSGMVPVETGAAELVVEDTELLDEVLVDLELLD